MTPDTDTIARAVDGARTDWTKHLEEQRKTIRKLLQLFDVPQTEIAQALGLTRQTLNQRIAGTTTFKPWELTGIAKMLDVPEDVLDLPIAEAIRWILDHPQGSDGSMRIRWSPLSSQRIA
jgi:hypothetical protein